MFLTCIVLFEFLLIFDKLIDLLIRFEVFIHKVDGLSDDTKEFRHKKILKMFLAKVPKSKTFYLNSH